MTTLFVRTDVVIVSNLSAKRMPFLKPRAVCAALHRHYAVEHFCMVVIVPAFRIRDTLWIVQRHPESLRRVYKCGILRCAVPCSRKFIFGFGCGCSVWAASVFRRLSEIGYKRVVCSSRGQQCVAHETK